MIYRESDIFIVLEQCTSIQKSKGYAKLRNPQRKHHLDMQDWSK